SQVEQVLVSVTGPAWGRAWLDLMPDLYVHGFFQGNRANDERHGGHRHRVPQTRVDVPGRGTYGESYQRDQPAEHAVAYVVWQGERRVPDLGRKCFHQIRGNRAVHHGHVDDLDEHQENQQWNVRIGRLFRRDQLGWVLRIGRQRGQGPGLRHWVLRGLERDHIIAGSALHGVVQRVVSDYSQQTACHDDLLAADLVGKGSEDCKERHSEQHGQGNNDEPGTQVHLQYGLQIEQRIILSRVPDHALAGGRAQQGYQHQLEVGPLGESVLQRLGRTHSRALDVLKDG